jgi:hypothetical protein
MIGIIIRESADLFNFGRWPTAKAYIESSTEAWADIDGLRTQRMPPMLERASKES